MSRFLLHFLLFLLPIVVIAFLADAFISHELKKSNSYAVGEYPVWNDLYNGKVNSKVVIYGASRAWLQIDPAMISAGWNTTAYNLGIDGLNFQLEYLRHNLLLKYNTKPRLIIFSVDDFTLSKIGHLYNYGQFLPYMLWNNGMNDAIKSFNYFNYSDYNLPLARYCGDRDALNEALKMFLNPANNPVLRKRGFESRNALWDGQFYRIRKKLKFLQIEIDTSQVMLFEKFLNECSNENIKMVFVYTPEFIEGQNFVRNHADVIALYSGFAKKYKIPFYDFSTDTMSYKTKYFYNVAHLNTLGATVFTRKLIDTLRNVEISAMTDEAEPRQISAIN